MAKKRIPEVPRDGSEVDFIPENFMLIDGAEGSAKMRMDLFGKESSIEELDEVKYEKPEDGIPKTDLAIGVQDSLGLADTALQASDIEGKANKSEMIISAVTGDTTKKNIQLKNGLVQTVVVEHQDVTGKADKSEMSITDVSGDTTKKTIQLKNNLSQTVLVEHQDISGKVGSDEMRITDVSGDTTKKTIQLKTGLSQDVVVAHQDISEKVGRNEMAVIEVIGDTTKRSIQLNSQLSQDVIVAHQDVSGKANLSEMDITAVSGDETKKTIQLADGLSQDVVVDISGKADVEDVLTTWTRDRANPSQVTGTLSLNSTIDPTRIEVNLDNTIAGDLHVGHLVPTVINDDRGKVLMVTQTTGIAWQPLPPTELQEYPGTQSAHIVQGTLGFITDSGPKRTSAYLAVTDSDPTCLGMLVPPVKSEDAGRILTVDVDDGPVWRDPPRTDTEWDKLNPYTQEFGVLKFVTSFNEEETNVWVNHHTSAYIGTVDVSGWVGEFLPHYETSDAGKILMVSPTRGPEWVNMPGLETTWKYGDSETRQGTLSVGTTLEYDYEEQVYYPHHSSAYIEYNSSQTWLGAFVPPTDIGDSGKVLMVDPSKGVEWKSPSELKNYNAGTGITIGYNDNSINVSHPLPDVTPGADKILSTDANGNLTWMPKYTGNNYGIKVDPTTNVISRGYQVIDTRVHETLTGATLNTGSSIKYRYRYSIPLDWTAGPFGYMIVDWTVVCNNGRKNNPTIGVGFSKELIGGGWNATWGNNVEVPGIIMQDSVSSWRAESRAIGHFTHYGLDFQTLEINIYADNGVFTSTDEVNVELSIMFVGYYSRESQANT